MPVKLPTHLVETKYNGYFWSHKEKQLYSIKIDGILKPLKLYKKFCTKVGDKLHFSDIDHYQVSVNGNKRYLFVNDLESLPKKSKHIIPIIGK